MNRRVTSLLLGLNLLLVLALALLWWGPGSSTQWEPPAAQAPNLDDARAALLGQRPEISAEFPQIAARPLFSSTRRPVPEDAATPEAKEAPPPPPVELDKLQIVGTINGPTMRGVLAELEGESRFIRSGEQVGEWTLRGISSNEASFEKGDEKRVVPLPLAGGGDAGKAAAQKAEAAKPKANRPATPPARQRAAPPPPKVAPAPVRPAATPAQAPAAKASGPIGSWGP